MANENMQTDDERFPKLEQDGWNGALRQQEEQNRVMEEQRRNAAMAEQIGANRGVYEGYVRVGDAVNARRAQFVNNANAHLASALRLAAENGGRLPQYAWQGLGGGLGLDGKNGAVVGGGYDRNGGFTLMVARRNQQTGQVEQAPMTFTPQDQYKLMLSAPGIFSRQEVDGMRGQLIDNYHMHPDQVPEAPQGWGETGNVGIGNRTASGGTSVNPNWLYGPQRHSTISAFGANGRGGFTQYYSGDETGNQLVSQDFGTRAAENKGRWKVLSRGADPSRDDGTQITRYENDKTGEVVSVRDGETPPREQLDIVNATPGVWGNDGIEMFNQLYSGLRNTMGKSELPPQGVYADNLRAYNTQKQSADTLKMMTGLYQAVYKDMSKGGRQPVTTDAIRARMASDLLKDKNIGPQITSVPDLNEDGTQKMVEDENGQQVPAMRQADPNNPDDVERVKQNLKMRLDLVPELAPRQDQQGGGETDRRLAFLKYIYDRENPQTPPDVLAFQQRQRERQMRQVEEAQARKDITQRPQQLINYFKDGRWYSGNGYIRDGKVYDGQGYEIEGATPAEMARNKDGSVYSNENGWVARALPSARELVGVSAGGGNASEVAAQGAQAGTEQQEQPATRQAQQPAQGTQGAQRQPAKEQGAQADAQYKDLLDPNNADAFIADVNKGVSPERSRAIEVEAAAKAEKARRQKQSAEPIDDREWADEMKQLNESTGGVVQRDRGAEARTAARDFFSSVFDDIARDATIAADRAVAFDKEHVGAGKGITRESAYKIAFTQLVNKKLGEMSEEDRSRLERLDPGNLASHRINLRQSLYDRYGVDVYDGGRGFVGAITGVGNLDNRGGYYEDLVDSDGNVKKGTWRRGGDAYGEYGRSVSLWR